VTDVTRIGLLGLARSGVRLVTASGGSWRQCSTTVPRLAAMTPRTRIQLFRAVAVTEALSWAGLLVGMYFKYLTDAGELGVKVFGPVHGGVFVAYVVLTLVVARTQRWSLWVTLVGLASAVPPFTTLAFERWTLRTGRLDVAGPAPAREPAPAS
jgi:integral membrane protein